MSARVIQVIETVVQKGLGIPGDPVRQVTQYWTFDGKLLSSSEGQEIPLEKSVKIIGGVRKGPDYVEIDQP